MLSLNILAGQRYVLNVGTHNVLFNAILSMFCPDYYLHCGFIMAYSHSDNALVRLPYEKL